MSTKVHERLPLAAGIKAERAQRNWSLDELARRSGVSKAMLSKIERDEASPTAELLVRIAAAFSMTLSALIARAEASGGTVMRAVDQPRWTDPATGYVRRHLSPPSAAGMELVRVELPAGAAVSFPAASYAFMNQMMWMIAGRLHFREGAVEHKLEPGDCLSLGAPADCRFFAPGPDAAVYLVAILKR